MKCVEKCDPKLISYVISNDQSKNFKYCRDTNYYVNPASNMPFEYGTKRFPFKSLIWPAKEIVNTLAGF